MIAMRDFLWQYFSMTGEIDAYLLYKQHETMAGNTDAFDEGTSDVEQAFASDLRD